MQARSLAVLCAVALSGNVAAAIDPRTPAEAWTAVPFTDQSGGTTSHTAVDGKFLVYHNPWFHNERFYAVKWPESPSLPPRSPNAGNKAKFLEFPTKKPDELHAIIQAHWLGGVSLLADFAFQTAASNLGQWAEVMIPIFCTLASEPWQALTGHSNVTAIVIPAFDRTDLQGLSWVWEMWRVVLSPTGQHGIPRLIFKDDLNDVGKQHWLCFEHLLSAHDRYSDSRAKLGFWSSELAQRFRGVAFEQQELKAPSKPPPTITYLEGLGNTEVMNQPELVRHLWDTAQALGLRVRPFSVTAAAPFSSFLAAMARTGVLVAPHNSLLTNAIFLPPGALVVELLPFHWEWNGFSRLYKNLTASMGDIHHVAWRARHAHNAHYNSSDDARFSNWATQECISAECVTVHGQAGIVADAGAVQELLHRVLPAVMSGKSVAEAELPWPPVDPELAMHLFQWQRS